MPPRFSHKRDAAAAPAVDADHTLLAFIGVVGLLLGGVFWGVLALRAWATPTLDPLVGWAALAAAFVGTICAWMAWGVRAKLDRGEVPTGWELRRLILVGAIVGIALGALPFVTLAMRLRDPDLYHAAAEPNALSPGTR